MPPPPPPPPPPPGMGGPPPPPPPPPGNLPSRPPAGNRGALLGDIQKGKALRKAVTNDRSAPIVGKVSGGSGSAPLGGAPPIPGMSKPPGGLAPPVPNGGNRARSNSDQGGRDNGVTGMEQPPQLAGIFAGGMPKLKKRGGGVDTGANRESSSTSDPESSRSSFAPRPPISSAPRLPAVVPPRPGAQNRDSAPAFSPSVANLRKTANLSQRPASSASTKGPPPPIGKKPPAPPGSRKPSTFSQAPSAPPPPPSSSAPPPPAAPPPPPMSAPRPPISSAPSRSQPPPPPPPATSPPPINGGGQSLAMQAAIRAAGQASPAAAPPPPPPGPPQRDSYRAPSPPSAAPPPPSSRPPTAQPPQRGYIDPSSYTLSSNGSLPVRPSSKRNSRSGASNRLIINDPRWKFQDENTLPKPREFIGGPKKYRAGRGSSVPLDLSSLH